MQSLIAAINQKKSDNNNLQLDNIYGRVVFVPCDETGNYEMPTQIESRSNRNKEIVKESIPFCFMLGPDSLKHFPGCTTKTLLCDILGWSSVDTHLQSIEANRMKIILILVDATNSCNMLQTKLATYDNIIELAPNEDIKDKLRKFSTHFKSLQGDSIDMHNKRVTLYNAYYKAWDLSWYVAWSSYVPTDEEQKICSPIMTFERFQSIPFDKVTDINCRRLLYDYFFCNENYSYDGYTYSSNGKRGLKEYFMNNIHLKDYSNNAYEIVELPFIK